VEEKKDMAYAVRQARKQAKMKRPRDIDSDDEQKMKNPSGNKRPKILQQRKKKAPIDTMKKVDKLINTMDRTNAMKGKKSKGKNRHKRK